MRQETEAAGGRVVVGLGGAVSSSVAPSSGASSERGNADLRRMVDQVFAGLEHLDPAAHPHREPVHVDDFAGMYIRHRASFVLHARRYLRDPRDADEVVQEAFLRLFLALPELETELQALAYCRRTITNLCIDRYRASARRPTTLELEAAADVVDPASPEQQAIQQEDAATARAALSLLSPLHREALVKREVEEKSLPVIAADERSRRVCSAHPIAGSPRAATHPGRNEPRSHAQR